MSYQFPIIRHIDDVLPHIEDRPEIIVAKKDGYQVVNYVVSTPDLWAVPVSTLKGQIIRECRGMIFDDAGKLISRPLHKFFNVGEKEETLPQNIDFTGHSVYDKLDGSMIRPIMLDRQVRLATKMGITDTSIQCENWMYSDNTREEDYYDFLQWCTSTHRTPIFEWISRDNKIVIKYDESSLVLLALRDNETGQYATYERLITFGDGFQIPVVKRYNSFDSISDFLEKTKAEIGNEGYVVELADGNRVKIKTDEYCRIHKIKERVQQPRHVIALIIDEQIDDAKAGLDEVDLKKVEDIETDYHINFHRREKEIDAAWEIVKSKHEDKRDFAINTDMSNVTLKKFMFSKFNGKSTRDLLTDLVRQNINGEKRYQEFLDEYFAK